MKAIKAIGVALISLMTLSSVNAQQVVIKAKTQPHYGKKKVVVTDHRHRYHSHRPHSGVIVDKHYSGYRRPYYYDRGRSRYYYISNGHREYYHRGWRPAY